MKVTGSCELRPFGLDVQKDEDGDKMPPAAACLGDCMVSRLSSRRDQWMKTRAVLTQSSLFLSKSSDQTQAVHRIPLHEITKIGRVGKDEGNSLFDLLIVGISLLSMGPLDLDFVKNTRFLRVFRMFRSSWGESRRCAGSSTRSPLL